MCRFVAYTGKPVYLETQLSAPQHSLIAQSREARESMHVVNADGCGIGWYGERDTPGLYRSLRPAWGDANLLSLCQHVRSPMFAGHIRAATSGEVATANCHPFAVGNHMFLHNGEIGGFGKMRHRIERMIPEHLYTYRKGTSDSEAIFLNALGHGLEDDPVGAIARSLTDIVGLMGEMGLDEPLYFAAIHSDGETLHAFRWASRHIAPTLYHRNVETGVVIASEPYDQDQKAWKAVPEDSVITIGPNRKVEVRPFMAR